MDKNLGFTIIEFVFAVIVIAVIAAFAFVRYPSQDQFTSSGFAQQFANDLRLTTILSMSQNACYGITVASNAYTIKTNTGATYSSVIPDVTYPISQSGTTLTPSTTVYFNSLGQPFTDSTCTTAAASDTVFTITTGSMSNTVTVTQGTGAIQ